MVLEWAQSKKIFVGETFWYHKILELENLINWFGLKKLYWAQAEILQINFGLWNYIGHKHTLWCSFVNLRPILFTSIYKKGQKKRFTLMCTCKWKMRNVSFSRVSTNGTWAMFQYVAYELLALGSCFWYSTIG